MFPYYSSRHPVDGNEYSRNTWVIKHMGQNYIVKSAFIGFSTFCNLMHGYGISLKKY